MFVRNREERKLKLGFALIGEGTGRRKIKRDSGTCVWREEKKKTTKPGSRFLVKHLSGQLSKTAYLI